MSPSVPSFCRECKRGHQGLETDLQNLMTGPRLVEGWCEATRLVIAAETEEEARSQVQLQKYSVVAEC